MHKGKQGSAAVERIPPRQPRCAIYTRKSTEEGLQQEFNSLDAQRESGEAYILSQSHEGWECLPEHYDDGGYSGGNMDRRRGRVCAVGALVAGMGIVALAPGLARAGERRPPTIVPSIQVDQDVVPGRIHSEPQLSVALLGHPTGLAFG